MLNIDKVELSLRKLISQVTFINFAERWKHTVGKTTNIQVQYVIKIIWDLESVP